MVKNTRKCIQKIITLHFFKNSLVNKYIYICIYIYILFETALTNKSHSSLHLAGRTVADVCAVWLHEWRLKAWTPICQQHRWAVNSGYRPAAATSSTRGSRHPHPILCMCVSRSAYVTISSSERHIWKVLWTGLSIFNHLRTRLCLSFTAFTVNKA